MCPTRSFGTSQAWAAGLCLVAGFLLIDGQLHQRQHVQLQQEVPHTSVQQQPYCDINETSVVYVPIMKTRQVQQRVGILQKIRFKKAQTTVQTYEDHERQTNWRLVRKCCTGYEMSKLNICEPICEDGCPATSFCYAPNQCKCAFGYIPSTQQGNSSSSVGVGGHGNNRHHSCEPICSKGCPLNTFCSSPDTCNCLVGYRLARSSSFHCVPQCSSNCPFRGHCTAPEVCACAEGYRSEAGTCVKEDTGDAEEVGSTTPDTEADNTSTDDDDEDDWDKDTEEDDTDDHLTAEDYTPDGTALDVGPWPKPSCPGGWIWVNNSCQKDVFPSIEISCEAGSMKCPLNAICQREGGFCLCLPGFFWHKIKLAAAGSQVTAMGNSPSETTTLDVDLEDSSTPQDTESTTSGNTTPYEYPTSSEEPTTLATSADTTSVSQNTPDSDINFPLGSQAATGDFDYVCLNEQQLAAVKANGMIPIDPFAIEDEAEDDGPPIWVVVGMVIMACAALITIVWSIVWLVQRHSGEKNIDDINNLSCHYSRESYETKHMIL